MSDATRSTEASSETRHQAELEYEWSQLSDDQVLACRAEMVRQCQERGGRIAEFGTIFSTLRDPSTIRKAMVFIEAHGTVASN